MSGYDLCPKCNHRAFYFRAAFGTWKCYNCGFEKDGKKDGTAEFIYAEQWWNYLSAEEKINIYRKAKDLLKLNEEINNKPSPNRSEGESNIQ